MNIKIVRAAVATVVDKVDFNSLTSRIAGIICDLAETDEDKESILLSLIEGVPVKMLRTPETDAAVLKYIQDCHCPKAVAIRDITTGIIESTVHVDRECSIWFRSEDELKSYTSGEKKLYDVPHGYTESAEYPVEHKYLENRNLPVKTAELYRLGYTAERI